MTTATLNDSKSTFATISIPTEVSEGRVRDLLCGAFEGGSGYWISSVTKHYAEGVVAEDFKVESDIGGPYTPAGRFTLEGDYWPSVMLIPFVQGCYLTLTVEDEVDSDPPKTYKLDRDTMKRGLEIMAANEPKHFADFLDENDDAHTADVFLQTCLFGEAIYG